MQVKQQSLGNNNCRDNKTALIQAVRESVLQEAQRCIHDIYPEDLIRLQKSDLQVKRFIVRVRAQNEGDLIEKSKEEILRNLRWRREVGLQERNESTFPKEFFDVGLIGFATQPRTGKKIMYINCKAYRRQSELTCHFWAFGNALCDRFDRELNGQRMILFIDLSCLALINADINFMRYYLSILTYEFPLSIEQTYIYEPPWYLKHVVSLGLALFPKSLVKNVAVLRKEEAMAMFGMEGIPVAAGGTLDTFIPAPQDSPSVEDFAKIHDIPRHVIEKAKKDYGFL